MGGKILGLPTPLVYAIAAAGTYVGYRFYKGQPILPAMKGSSAFVPGTGPSTTVLSTENSIPSPVGPNTTSQAEAMPAGQAPILPGTGRRFYWLGIR